MRKAILPFLLFLLIISFCGKKEEKGTIEVTQQAPDVSDYMKKMKPLSGMNVLLIIAHKDFMDNELATVKALVESLGGVTTIASTIRGKCKGSLKGEVDSQITLSEVDVDNYDGIVFIGGLGVEDDFYKNSDAMRIAREAVERDKVLGAMTIAPAILAKAGVLKGKKATVYIDPKNPEERGILKSGGAQLLEGEPIVVDGNIITCMHPEYSQLFADGFADLLKKKAESGGQSNQ
ncbi:MAG: DJ-1/PfpI family protein [bacterium]